jgi:oxygen-independent coproporphyrinogen-3 oxidase
LLPYEISNYARPGAESRHNLAYWRYADYAGIGPGAHGRVMIDDALIATRRHRAPEAWAERVEADGHGSTAEEIVAPRDRAREALLMGLRLAEGIELDWFARRTGVAMCDAVDGAMLQACVEAGYLEQPARRLRVTAEGRRRLDAMLPRLVH